MTTSLASLKAYISMLAKKTHTQDFCKQLVGKRSVASDSKLHVWYSQPPTYQPLPSLPFLMRAFPKCLLSGKHSAKP